MARQIVWTEPALKDRRSILSYWTKRNASKTYSRKLFLRFREATLVISTNPYMGRATDYEGLRVMLVGVYKLFYSVTPTTIHIARVIDGRRDLSKLKF